MPRSNEDEDRIVEEDENRAENVIQGLERERPEIVDLAIDHRK